MENKAITKARQDYLEEIERITHSYNLALAKLYVDHMDSRARARAARQEAIAKAGDNDD